MKLVKQGTLPRLEAVNLETQSKAAEAALAAAEAEKDRSVIRAPWAGIINDVPVEIGQAVFSFMGKEIAQIVSIDPILAVVEVAERSLAGVHARRSSRDPAGHRRQGRPARSASSPRSASAEYPHLPGRRAKCRTPTGRSRMESRPRSRSRWRRPGRARAALRTHLLVGRRAWRAHRRSRRQGRVREGLVSWTTSRSSCGSAAFLTTSRVIVQGQDFVREGQTVEPVDAEPPQTAAR